MERKALPELAILSGILVVLCVLFFSLYRVAIGQVEGTDVTPAGDPIATTTVEVLPTEQADGTPIIYQDAPTPTTTAMLARIVEVQNVKIQQIDETNAKLDMIIYQLRNLKCGK